MGRKSKYTLDDIKRVNELILQGSNVTDAAIKAGFPDQYTFYNVVKRLGLKRVFVEVPSKYAK